jgi:hypothetical protein
MIAPLRENEYDSTCSERKARRARDPPPRNHSVCIRRYTQPPAHGAPRRGCTSVGREEVAEPVFRPLFGFRPEIGAAWSSRRQRRRACGDRLAEQSMRLNDSLGAGKPRQSGGRSVFAALPPRARNDMPSTRQTRSSTRCTRCSKPSGIVQAGSQPHRSGRPIARSRRCQASDQRLVASGFAA